MKKILIFLILLSYNLFAHPVSYTIELEVSYDEDKKEATVICKSNSKNKCGLYNIKLLDSNTQSLMDVKFPFLKEKAQIKIDKKPTKLEFYLRDTPEHKYFKTF